MAINLLETIKAQFGDDLIKAFGEWIGEQPAQTRAATARAGEATLAGLIHRGSTPDGATALANVFNDAKYDSDGLAALAASAQQAGSPAGLIDQGKALLSSLFGDRADGLARWVSSASGVGQGSALSLMSLMAPSVLGFIKRHFGGNLDAGGLRNYLDGQRGFLEKSAPAGLLSVLGWQSWTPAAAGTVARDAPRPAPAVIGDPAEPARSAFPWHWLLLLLGLLGLGFFLMRGCNRVEDTAVRTPAVPAAPATVRTPAVPAAPATVRTPAVPAAPATAPAVPTAPATPKPEIVVSAPQPVALVLRDQVKLMVLPGSIEQRLVAFIEDVSKAPDEKTWFTFDGLEFETGKSTLKPSSQERLKHVAAVMKAYPAVNIKIGGYTDNVGDPQLNLKISGERARATLQELVNMGIAANRMDAEGYGEQHPVADNATEQGRQKNRRVDIRVTAK